jgi:hypothetical protein
MLLHAGRRAAAEAPLLMFDAHLQHSLDAWERVPLISR